MMSRLQEWVLKDFGLKLFSLGLAVLTWFTVSSMANQREGWPVTGASLAPPERVVISNLPVTIISSAEDVRSFRVNPKEVEVTLQGEARVLKNLQSKDIRVQVDLTGIGAAHDLRKRIEVITPAGVTYVKVDPEAVQVIFPQKNE
jgi:YbbR domain-containing protein